MPQGFVSPTAGKNYSKMIESANARAFSDEIVFVENSSHPRHRVKERIIKRNLIAYVCEECKQDSNWNGKKLVLQLDHKNGINNDNRLENLRFLCPNCHSQQDTYAAKNKLNIDRKPKKYYKSKSIS